MGWLFDIIWALWTVLGGWLLLRRGPWLAVRRVVSITAGYAVALGSGLLALQALICLKAPAWSLLLVPPGAAMAGFLLGGWTARRLCTASAIRLAAHRHCAALMHGARLVLVLIGILWSAAQVLVYLLLVNLATAAWPGLAATLHDRSLLAGHLLSPLPPRTAALPGGRDTPYSDAGSIDTLLQDTGVRSLMAYFRVMHELIVMDQEHRERVLAAFPAIDAAASSPALTAVLGDDRLLSLITRACHGSLPAVLDLAHEPAMQRLCQDPLIRAAAQQFDVQRLQAVLEQPAEPDPHLHWKLAALPTSLDLARQLASVSGWTAAGPGALLTWSAATPYGLARVQVPAHPLDQQLRLLSEGTCACYLDGRRSPAHLQDGFAVLDLPHGPAQELVLLVYFAAAGTPRRCLVSY